MTSTARFNCKVCGKEFDGDAILAFEHHQERCVPKDNSDIMRDTVEALELTIRSARRCAYDLTHAADMIALGRTDAEMATMFRERAGHFIRLFQSGNAMKDYRHKLWEQIEDHERTIEKLRAILAEHKIDDPTIF